MLAIYECAAEQQVVAIGHLKLMVEIGIKGGFDKIRWNILKGILIDAVVRTSDDRDDSERNP
jgi:hypothetical protein